MIRLGIVCPCYNEQEILMLSAKRLTALLEELSAKQKISSDLLSEKSNDYTHGKRFHVLHFGYALLFLSNEVQNLPCKRMWLLFRLFLDNPIFCWYRLWKCVLALPKEFLLRALWVHRILLCQNLIESYFLGNYLCKFSNKKRPVGRYFVFFIIFV